MSAVGGVPLGYLPAEMRIPAADGYDRVTAHALLDPVRPRAVLALASDDGEEIDWALGRLLRMSYQASEPGIRFHQLPELLEILVSYPVRLAHALAGHAHTLWPITHAGAPDTGLDPAGDWDFTPDPLEGDEVTPAHEGAMNEVFVPETNPEHNALLRRALEATTILRNAALDPAPLQGALPNSRLISRSGILNTIKIALELVLQQQGLIPPKYSRNSPKHDEAAAAGLNEFVLNLLDLLESFAEHLKADVSHGNDLYRLVRTLAFGRCHQPIGEDPEAVIDGTSDRSMLISALRILTKMVSQPNNAATFHEGIPPLPEKPPSKESNPALVSSEFHPLTWQALHFSLVSHDHDLLESALDLLHELVVVAQNGLCLASYPGLRAIHSFSQLPAGPSAVALPLLLRAIVVHRTTWEREAPVTVRTFHSSYPSFGQDRAKQYALEDSWKRTAHQSAASLFLSRAHLAQPQQQDSITPEQPLSPLDSHQAQGQAKNPLYHAMRLTEDEVGPSSEFASLVEPQRSRYWVTSVFESDVLFPPSSDQSTSLWEVPQSEFCAAYQDSVALANSAGSISGKALLSNDELLNLSRVVFNGAGPHVSSSSVTPNSGNVSQFVVRGIRVRLDRLVRASKQVNSDPHANPTMRKLCQDWLQTNLAGSAGAPAWARAGASDPSLRPSGACPWASCLTPGSSLDARRVEEHCRRHVAEAGGILSNPPTSVLPHDCTQEAHGKFTDAHQCLWHGCYTAAPAGLDGTQVHRWLEAHILTHLPFNHSKASTTDAGLPIDASWTSDKNLHFAQSFFSYWASPLDPVPGLAHWLPKAPITSAKRVRDEKGHERDGRKRLRLLGESDNAVERRHFEKRNLSTHDSDRNRAPEAGTGCRDEVPWYLTTPALALSSPLRTEKAPGSVKFVVARTPLLPQSSTPTGCAATAALLIRSVTAQIADVLGLEDDDHGEEVQLMAQQRQTRSRAITKDQASLVGFPFAPGSAPAPRRAAPTFSSNGLKTPKQPASPSKSDIVEVERAVARSWIDALLDAETYVVLHSASNDVLTGILQDALACLPRPRVKRPLQLPSTV